MLRNPERVPLIATKLVCPRYHGKTVQRVLLAERLSNSDCHVLLVLAPAGYGKTVFLSQFAEDSSHPFAWYSLDSHDNDLITFIRHLAAALRKDNALEEAPLRQIVSMLDPDKLCRSAVSFFVQALQAKHFEHANIILDNWHVISDPLIYSFLDELIPLLPPTVRLILCGRSSLELAASLNLHRLHVAGQLQVFTRQDLQFTDDELKCLCSLSEVSIEDCFDKLRALSGGWPIAANYFAKHGKVDTCQDAIPPAMASYIERDVLQGHPRDIVEFLSKVSVLPRFSASDCDQLLEQEHSQDSISYLESQQLFLDKADEKYRLNPLIRSYFADKLSSEKSALYRKAGAITLKQGDPDQAIACFIEAGDRERATEVVVQFGDDFISRGRWQTVAKWLKTALTPEEIQSRPRLLLLQGLVEIGRGQLAHAQRAVNQAETLFRRHGDQTGLAECKLLRARISRGLGTIGESFRYLFDAESNLSASRLKLLKDIEKSVMYYSSGRLQDARDVLEKCLREVEQQGDQDALVVILEALGNVCYLLGEVPRALSLFKRGMSLCPEGVMPGYNFQDVMSAIYDDWGETEQALLIAQRSLAVKEKMGLTEDIPSACLQLACVYTNLGRFEEAERYFHRGIDYVREHDSDRSGLALNLVFLARALSLQGRWVEARAYAQEALELAEAQPRLFRTSVPAVAGPILAYTGSWDEGIELLKQAEKRASSMAFAKGWAYCCQSLAYLYRLQGDEEQAKVYAHEALIRSAKINDLQNFVTCYRWYYPILLYGLTSGTEISFVQRVLRKVGVPCLEHLIPLAVQGDAPTKQRIIPVLLEIGGPEAVRVLETLSRDPNVPVRNLAAQVYRRLTGVSETQSSSTRPVLRLHVLGAVRLFQDEEEIVGVKWRSLRARDLLIYLVHARQPVSKDQIIEALWPEDCADYEKADAKFHTTVYRLRSVLKQYGFTEMIKHGSDAYSLDGIVETDLERFESLIKAAAGLEQNSPEQMKLLEEALENYHGDYLEYLDYDWLIQDRESLRLRYCETKLQLINCYLAASHYEKAISELVSLLRKDELNEIYHSLLILAYAKSGQRLAAQRQYARLTEILEEELGVKPSLEIQTLCKDLRLGPAM